MSDAGWVARCPAKVNLTLRVLGRRDDGYHELDTVFQAIDLDDVVTVVPDERVRRVRPTPGVPDEDSDLVVRAARAAARAYGVRVGAAFEVRKSIPRGAGLGGGSSDAAAALLLCERLWGVEPDPNVRWKLAASIGADVPFFLVGGTARGTGRGDRIRPAAVRGPAPLLLGFPGFGASTGEVFAALSPRLTLPVKDVSVPRLSGAENPRIVDVCAYGNDLESAAFERWPTLRRFRDGLREVGAGAALLSGSGSTVYGVFDTNHQRDRAAEILAGRFREWSLVRSVSVAHGIRIDRIEPDR